MDSLPADEILKFNNDTMSAIREMYNLDKPGQIDEAINLLEDWVKKEGHLKKKDFSREYLERAIILHKGSVERAKLFINKLCTLKTLMPHYLHKFDAKKDFEYISKVCSVVTLPQLTDDNYRVLVVKIWNNQYTRNMIYDCYKFFSLLCEYAIAHDYFVGCIAILDYRDINVTNLLPAVNLTELNEVITLTMKGYAFRMKGIHFITASKAIDTLLSIVKKLLSTKVGNRVFVHSDISSLYEHVPKKILPVELDGNEKSLSILYDEWLSTLSSEENKNYMKEMMTKAIVDKSYKQYTELNETFVGLNGTFRSLSVD